MKPETVEKIIAIVIYIPAFIIGSLAIRDGWNWFIAPLGVSTITMAHAIGIDALVSYICIMPDDTYVERQGGPVKCSISSCLRAIMYYIILYGLHFIK